MAGNVTANVSSAGDLVVNGDGKSNDIIVELLDGGIAIVYGLNGTTIDEGNLGSTIVSGDVRINLRGGNDRVTLREFTPYHPTLDDVRGFPAITPPTTI